MGSELPINNVGSGSGPLVPVVSPWPPAMQQLAGYDDGGSVNNMRRYVSALRRHQWLILAVTLLGTAAGVFAARYLKPKYVAQAAVWIQASQRGESRQGPIQSAQLLQAQAWVELVRSYEVLDSVVRQLRLFVQPSDWRDRPLFQEFGLAARFRPGNYRLGVSEDGAAYELRTGQGALMEQGTTGDSIGTRFGFGWAPSAADLRPGRAVAFSVEPPRDAALRLREEITFAMDRDGNFLRLDLSGPDPTGIADILNATVDRYVDVAAALKRDQLTAKRVVLEEQLAIAETNVNDAERALEEFRVRTITLPSEPGTPVAPGLLETRDPVFENFFSMQVEREALERDRIAIERLLRQAPADTTGGGALDGLNVIGVVRQSTELTNALEERTSKQAELRGLRYRYTEDHPDVQRALLDLRHLQREVIPELVRGLLAELQARSAALNERVQAASRELQAIPQRAIIEGRLRRDLAISSTLYTDLQSRFGEARLAEASSFPDVSVLDRAVVPQTPVTDDKLRMMLLGFALSVGLGVGLAILLDRFDRRVRYPEQVTDDLGLSILGAVLHVRKTGRGAVADQGQLVEALRGIRLGLSHAYGSAGPLVVTITSPGSGDGKSFLSRHLAVAYAEAGHRTLLVDGDIRRGELHRGLDAKRRPGLTDFLRSDAGREELVQETNVAGLHFIGAGARMHDGPELLASPAMQQLLLSLRASFGVIIMDSPPLSAGVDPFVLGSVTGALILVVRNGVTDRELASAKLEIISRLPIRVLGAVMNDIRPDGQYRYYAYHYHEEGYETRDEEIAPPNVAAATRLPRRA